MKVSDHELDIVKGVLRGHAMVNKAGRNTDVDSGSTPEDIWDGGGVYTGFPLGAAEKVTIVSSSVLDAAAGTGARTVTIYGLDALGALQSEVLTLNGTTPVDSANTYTRIYSQQVTTSGSTNTAFNAGTLTVAHKVTTENIFSVMPIGQNQSALCVYTIPAGCTGYLQYLEVMLDKGTSATATGALWVREYGKAPRLIRNFSLAQTAEHLQHIAGGLRLPALTDITVRITTASTTNLDVTAHMDMVVVTS
jgi:hypothetical protein